MPRTTLRLEDQVNARFLDLDPHVRRQIVEKLKFMVPHARHTPAFKLGRWDGKVSFAGANGSTYINLLDRVLPLVLDAGYEIDIEDQRAPFSFAFEAIDENYLADRTWPKGHPFAGQPIMMRDHQVAAVNRFMIPGEDASPFQCIQELVTSAGKAQPLYSKIKTPSGWTTMGEIKVGDVITVPDGSSANVIGTFPQGEKEIWRLTLADGRSADACADHLWKVYDVNIKDKAARWRIMTTSECAASMKQSPTRHLKLCLPKHPDLPDADLPLDPYVLGAVIGDGGLAHTMKTIRDLALHVKSELKFIPAEYLHQTSLGQKILLLQGLMDTDGYVDSMGRLEFTTVSEQLALDVQYLVRAIGGRATLRSKIPKGERKQGRRAYTLAISYADEQSLVRVKRKRDRLRGKHRGADRISIKSITPIGMRDAKCIMVDHPDHLYITDDFVVTHNTIVTAAMSKAVESVGRSLIIVPNTSLVKQTEEDYVNIGLDVGVFFGLRKEYDRTHTIATWQSLAVYDKNSRKGTPEIPIETFLDGIQCVIVDECFAAATPVLTLNGWVAICDIKPGDRVINYSETDQTFKLDEVVQRHENLTTSASETMFAVYFNDATRVEVTGNHKFLTTQGWLRADTLTGEHTIVGWNAPVRLTARTQIDRPSVTYNLHVRDDHNYVAAGAVVANCHSAKAVVLTSLLSGALAKIPMRFGLTGTVPKEDYEFLGLLGTIGPVVGKVSAVELQTKGILATCQIEMVETQDVVDLADWQSESKWLSSDTKRMAWLADYCQALALTGNTLVLVNKIECGQTLEALCPGSNFVYGSTKLDERTTEYKDFIEADNKLLFATYGVASTGISINRIHNLVIFEAGKSAQRVIQSVGRGLRVAKDKQHVIIKDIYSKAKFSKRHAKIRKGYYNEAEYPNTTTKVKPY